AQCNPNRVACRPDFRRGDLNGKRGDAGGLAVDGDFEQMQRRAAALEQPPQRVAPRIHVLLGGRCGDGQPDRHVAPLERGEPRGAAPRRRGGRGGGTAGEVPRPELGTAPPPVWARPGGAAPAAAPPTATRGAAASAAPAGKTADSATTTGASRVRQRVSAR